MNVKGVHLVVVFEQSTFVHVSDLFFVHEFLLHDVNAQTRVELTEKGDSFFAVFHLFKNTEHDLNIDVLELTYLLNLSAILCFLQNSYHSLSQAPFQLPFINKILPHFYTEKPHKILHIVLIPSVTHHKRDDSLRLQISKWSDFW